jgi:hypothetical protein
VQASAADRKRTLDRVFADVLPDTTADDRLGEGDAEREEHDRWLLDNRPPHHDTAP